MYSLLNASLFGILMMNDRMLSVKSLLYLPLNMVNGSNRDAGALSIHSPTIHGSARLEAWCSVWLSSALLERNVPYDMVIFVLGFSRKKGKCLCMCYEDDSKERQTDWRIVWGKSGTLHSRKCNFLMNPYVRLFVSWMVHRRFVIIPKRQGSFAAIL